MPSRGPPHCGISLNAYHICHHKCNHTTRVGCVLDGLGQNTSFTRHGSRNAAKDDPRPSILQLNTEKLPANKISVTEQLACKNKAVITVLHRPTAQLQIS